MTKNEPFQFTTGVIAYPLFFVLLIWIVYSIEINFNINFNSFGIYPRTIMGLRGILFSPFIHSGIKHLFNNTIPLYVLSAALFYFYRSLSWKVLGFGLVFSGLLTWIIGRPSYHIGASGIIYLLASFLFFKGIFSKYYRLVALSLVVTFLYGGLFWYITPIDPEISWEGHLSGFLLGLLFSFIFKKQLPIVPKYDWEQPNFDEEQDDFMKHFDENGNFIENATLYQDFLEEKTSENKTEL
ncbi:rhomboid family intramembrane serine protease [Zunongwangia sp.]|uniref:rhomboid family intramembrane serine protease n=1 Tax=Zunongwangia sp. TaxID=1965325 RepID=UPI003AA9827F